jgi:site-specific DNA recombinase
MATRAVGYIRVSTPLQVAEGESLDTQRQQIEDFVKQHGWQMANIYEDQGKTGTKVEYRTGFQLMMNDAKEKKFEVIVFTKLSRFARNARDYQNYSHELNKYGIQIFSIKENIDPTTPIGKMIAGMLALFAEWEHETIREQMYENKMVKWKEKRAFIGKPPFGYVWNKESKKLEVYKPDADVYYNIVKMYCEQGMPMRDIAIQLNNEGLKCKRSVWSSGTISYILKNQIYYGLYVVNQFVYIDGNRGAGTKRTKKRKPESEAITFPVDPLISKPEWDRIQQITKHNKIIPKRTSENTMSFFLRSVLVCGRCGSRMNARMGSTKKDGSFLRYYVCYYSGTSKKSIETHRQKCDLPYIPAKDVEAAVWSDIMVMFALNPKQAFKDMFDPVKHQEQIDNQINIIFNLEQDLARNLRTNKRILKIIKDLDDKEFNSESIGSDLISNEKEKYGIQGRLSDAKVRLKELQGRLTREKEAFDFMKKNKKQLDSIRNDIRNLSMTDRRILVESMLKDPVVVDYEDPIPGEHGGGVAADYKIHFNPEIIKRFIEEGKIGQLNINSSDNNTSSHPRGGIGNDEDPFGSRKVR